MADQRGVRQAKRLSTLGSKQPNVSVSWWVCLACRHQTAQGYCEASEAPGGPNHNPQTPLSSRKGYTENVAQTSFLNPRVFCFKTQTFPQSWKGNACVTWQEPRHVCKHKCMVTVYSMSTTHKASNPRIRALHTWQVEGPCFPALFGYKHGILCFESLQQNIPQLLNIFFGSSPFPSNPDTPSHGSSDLALISSISLQNCATPHNHACGK